MAGAVAPETLDALRTLGVATVYEAGGAIGAMDPAIHPLWRGARVCGPAFTVNCPPGDNLALHRCIEFVQPGDVLVVQNGGLSGGYWGGILTACAVAHGVIGLVLDGGCRDTEELEEIRFPVFLRGAGVFRTYKHEPGQLNVPIVVGGILVNPGDVILGDGDGVMSIPRDRVEEFRAAGQKRADAEAGYMERIRNGEYTMDIYGFPRS
ncbi:MAG: 4-hydroxy-4-methyl-2-oxoglutarate aldolase [Chloroflexota bacterium]|nr:4-hydroxy-4-methyl-2-oxoglutarate aldolase [Chloroflexota bacterium]